MKTLITLTRKVLAAHQGTIVQTNRMADLESNPGRLVPSRYPTVTAARAAIDKAFRRADLLQGRHLDRRNSELKMQEEHATAHAARLGPWRILKAQVMHRVNIEPSMIRVNDEKMRIDIGEPPRAERTWREEYFTLTVYTVRWSPSSGFRGAWIQELGYELVEHEDHKDRTTRYPLKGGVFNAKKLITRIEDRVRREIAERTRTAHAAVKRASFLDTLQSCVPMPLKMETDYVRDYGSRSAHATKPINMIKGQGAIATGTARLKASPEQTGPTFRVTLTADMTEETMRAVMAVLNPTSTNITT